jgi:hypothetical protein
MLVREDDEQCTKDPFAGSLEALDSELADTFTGCYGLPIRNLLEPGHHNEAVSSAVHEGEDKLYPA